MNIIEKAKILSYHKSRIGIKKKSAFKDLGWRSPESQLLRFEVLSSIGNIEDKTILDVGCGYGDLKFFLDKKYNNFRYIGIDLVFEFIKKAAFIYKADKNTTFYHGDFTDLNISAPDYTLASGVMGYKTTARNYYNELIKKMFEETKIAVGFNMLLKGVFPEHPLLKAHNIDEIEKFCKSITQNYIIKNDYLEDDFTIFLYR